MTLAAVTLEDKYKLDHGRVFLTGVQALARLPMLQHARDRAAGLNTAGYVSGYRGSPLGGLDTALHDAQRFLAEHNIKFQPGVNEDLAATAIWGWPAPIAGCVSFAPITATTSTALSSGTSKKLMTGVSGRQVLTNLRIATRIAG